MIIGAHLRVCDLERSPYPSLGLRVPQRNRTFTFDEVATVAREQDGVDAAVLVQADDHDGDTGLMLEVATLDLGSRRVAP